MSASDQLPSVSVVTPTLNRTDVIERTLSAVLADPATAEAIVIVDHDDEASRDTRQLLGKLAAGEPRLRVERTPEDSRGLWSVQRARDYGAELASSEIVLALDDDVTAHPGMVTGHARRHAEGHGRVVVGYMPVATREKWPRSNAPVRYYSKAYERHAELFAADGDAILRSLWGGNISLRRADWLQAVKRPRTTSWGHDDQELGLLFLRDGLHGIFDPQLKGDHWYRRTLRGFVARAGASAVAQKRLRAQNTDLLEPPAPEPPSRLRRALSPLTALSHTRPGWFCVRWGLMGAIAAAAVVRLSLIEDAAATHLWYMAQERSLAADESGPADVWSRQEG